MRRYLDNELFRGSAIIAEVGEPRPTSGANKQIEKRAAGILGARALPISRGRAVCGMRARMEHGSK